VTDCIYLRCLHPGLSKKVIGDHTTTCPRVDHPRSPNQLPHRRPERPRHTRHRLTRPQLPLPLQDRAEADHDEEPARVRELGPTSKAPEVPDVHDGRDDVGAHDQAVPPRDLTARTRTKHDEDVAEELVPEFAPELRHEHGHPGSVGDARPLCRRLAEECAGFGT